MRNNIKKPIIFTVGTILAILVGLTLRNWDAVANSITLTFSQVISSFSGLNIFVQSGLIGIAGTILIGICSFVYGKLNSKYELNLMSRMKNTIKPYFEKVKDFFNRKPLIKKATLAIASVLVISTLAGSFLMAKSHFDNKTSMDTNINTNTLETVDYDDFNTIDQLTREKLYQRKLELDQKRELAKLEEEKATKSLENEKSNNSKIAEQPADTNNNTTNNNQKIVENNTNRNEEIVSNSNNQDTNIQTPSDDTDREELIKDDQEENLEIEEDNDVEITTPEFVPEVKPDQPAQDDTDKPVIPETPDSEVTNPEETLPAPDQSDFEQPSVIISGDQTVKVGDTFKVSVNATDNVGVTTFNLNNSSILGLNSNVQLQDIALNGNSATITLKAVNQGDVNLSISSKVAIDKAGNSSAKSNHVSILIESVKPEVPEQPEIKPEVPEQPEISTPVEPEQPEISTPVEPEQPEITTPEFTDEPEEPVKPEAKPVVPEKPEIKPVVPEQPEIKPVVPEQPEIKPVVPEQPEIKPVVPEQPEIKPVVPEQPEISTPVEPEQPSDIEIPGEGEVSGDEVVFE